MQHIVFLMALGLVWVVFAVVQDLKTREVANWLNFSLIGFALSYRFFYSLFSSEGFAFFYQGLIGLGIFFILGNLFYYSRLFAGGDAKLMIALGPVIAFYPGFSENIDIFLSFLIIFLFAGAAYTLLASAFISLKNFNAFKREIKRQFNSNKRFYIGFILFALLVLAFSILTSPLLAYLGIVIFLFPYLHLYSKAVDESAMIKPLKPNELTEGDWLHKDLRIGKKIIKASWHGLTKQDISMIKKYHKNKKVKIRQGIPFTPVFLISFLALAWVAFI